MGVSPVPDDERDPLSFGGGEDGGEADQGSKERDQSHERRNCSRRANAGEAVFNRRLSQKRRGCATEEAV
jgi:hypothetical protein